jgi:thiamine biosynthesis lipoprotein
MPSANAGATPPSVYRFEAIGAPWRIDTPEPLGAAVTAEVAERIEQFDRTYSRFRDDSLVSRIEREPGRHLFPADAPPLFDLYRRLYTATGGAVSPLVGERLENLGYDRRYSLTPSPTAVRVPSWDNAVAWDGEALNTARPVLLDVGAAGKGYLVDLVAGILADAGITDYVVDASGDLVHRGATPLRIALEHPRDPTRAIGVVTLANAALCASASNRRAWGVGLHHVLDAVTGEPTSRVLATWAVVPAYSSAQPTAHATDLPTMTADGLSTGLFFRSTTELGASFSTGAVTVTNPGADTDTDTGTSTDTSTSTSTKTNFEAVRMLADGSVDSSSNFSGELFL